MTRSLSSVDVVVAALISNHVSRAANRRGFAAVSEASRKAMQAEKPKEKVPATWMPDPVTGYYRPENAANEIDAAKLREELLGKARRRKN